MHFAEPGTIALGPEGIAGAFFPAATLIGPRTLIYGPDIAAYLAAGGVGLYVATKDTRR